MRYETLDVRFLDGLCRIRLNRPEQGNAINARMLEELAHAVSQCEPSGQDKPVTVVVLEGAAEVFCAGGDFEAAATGATLDPEALYNLWTRLAAGPFVTIALVRGRVNAGGVGLACACDFVLCDPTAAFSLSELLFGLFPACVLPFLIRRTGVQKAHRLALMTRPITAEDALACGIADAVGEDIEALLRAYLPRLSKLSGTAVGRYKRYMAELSDIVARARPMAISENRAMFDDPTVRRNISRYVTEMKFPWEP
ncbi:enoyl-CoA hydratase/isomerase [Hyphomicrobium sp.]|uniref:enoyl-CoA hydratase/isomerase n=1 Tax=Hyphomicrobium sp. TaxID=82 RepID=UPI002E2F3293|nr:enoyl-CoA hydratase/isomerase [Hyphomicrobium sp.]HEX2841883.1 enoyl-CoA hydratase/isomerase [Hyphomicrobium sp.]